MKSPLYRSLLRLPPRFVAEFDSAGGLLRARRITFLLSTYLRRHLYIRGQHDQSRIAARLESSNKRIQRVTEARAGVNRT